MKIFKILRYVLLIGIVALAVSHLLPQLKDLPKLWDLKNKVNYWWIFAAVISQMTQYIGDGWLSKTMLQIVGIETKMKDTFRIASLNVFAAHILPIGEAGGIAAAYHFYKKLGVSPEKFIFLTVACSGLTNILLFILVLAPIPFISHLPITLSSKFIVGVLAFLCLVLAVYLNRRLLFSKLESILGKHSWFQHFAGFIKNRHEYKKLLKETPQKVIIAFLASLIYYASNIATLAFSFLAFGEFPPFALIVFAYSASLIFGRITLAPAGIGATEASLILIFLGSGANPAITVAAILVYRFISFWLPIPAGFFSFYSLRKGSKDTFDISENGL